MTVSSHRSFAVPEDGTRGDQLAGIETDGVVPATDDPEATARLVESLRQNLSRRIEVEVEGLADVVDDRWPARTTDPIDGTRARRPERDVDRIAASIELAETVRSTVGGVSLEAFRAAVATARDRLEAAVQARADVATGVAAVSVAVDATGTHAMETRRRRIARAATFVEETVRGQVRDALLAIARRDGDVDEAVAALRRRAPELADDHARVLSRIEVRQARRDAVAAVAEATDLVVGKRWRAAEDCEARATHAAMDGTVVPVADPFVVPAAEEADRAGASPCAVFVVGADRPFGCRCLQDLVLAADLPADVRELASWTGLDVDREVTDRQYEVWREHARDGEDFAALLERIDARYSRTRAAREFCNGSKNQYYGWLDEYGLK